MSKNYYDHADAFDIKPETYKFITVGKYPRDIKRIISCGNHTFHYRIYFYSPSNRQVYKLFSEPLRYQIRGNSHVYCLVDDMNKLYHCCVNDNFFTRTTNMSKIILPKLRK